MISFFSFHHTKADNVNFSKINYIFVITSQTTSWTPSIVVPYNYLILCAISRIMKFKRLFFSKGEQRLEEIMVLNFFLFLKIDSSVYPCLL